MNPIKKALTRHLKVRSEGGENRLVSRVSTSHIGTKDGITTSKKNEMRTEKGHDKAFWKGWNSPGYQAHRTAKDKKKGIY